jgi:CheY-like chemotaxis protein
MRFRVNPGCMETQRKTILVIDPSEKDPAAVRRLLGETGHIGVTVAQESIALRILRTVRFDVIFARLSGIGGAAAAAFIEQLRRAAPGSALVAIRGEEEGAARAPWQGQCDATIAAPLSLSRLRWLLDFDLRYFGS